MKAQITQPIEHRLHEITSLRKRCLKGHAAEVGKDGVTNVERLYWLYYELPIDALYGADGEKLYHGPAWDEWRQFWIQLAKSLANEVRRGCGRIGYMSDPEGPYQRLLVITGDHKIYDWSEIGVTAEEKRRWSDTDFMDVDFLAAEEHLFDDEEDWY